MAEACRRPEVLPTTAQVCRLPVRDRAVVVLFVPVGLGTLESQVGRVRGFGLCPGYHSRRHPAALPRRRPLGGDINFRGGGRRGPAGRHPRRRGCHESDRYTAEPVGPACGSGPSLPRHDVGWGRHVANSCGALREARPVPQELVGFHPMRRFHVVSWIKDNAGW